MQEYRDKVRRALTEALGNRTDYNVVMRADLPDGKRRWCRAKGRGFYNDRGKPARLVGMAWDITEPTLIREKLEESEERLRLAVSAANEAVWDWDCVSNRVNFNITYAEGYGRPSQEKAVKWWLEHVHPEDCDRVLESIGQALKGSGDSWSADYRFQMRDNAYAYVQDRANLIRDGSGMVRRMIGAMLDLTGRKRIEEELEKRTDQLIETTTKNWNPIAISCPMTSGVLSGRWKGI